MILAPKLQHKHAAMCEAFCAKGYAAQKGSHGLKSRLQKPDQRRHSLREGCAKGPTGFWWQVRVVVTGSCMPTYVYMLRLLTVEERFITAVQLIFSINRKLSSMLSVDEHALMKTTRALVGLRANTVRVKHPKEDTGKG